MKLPLLATQVYDGRAHPMEVMKGHFWLITAKAPHAVGYCTAGFRDPAAPGPAGLERRLGINLWLARGFPKAQVPKVVRLFERFTNTFIFDGKSESRLKEITYATDLQLAQVPLCLFVSRLTEWSGSMATSNEQFGIFTPREALAAGEGVLQHFWWEQPDGLLPNDVNPEVWSFWSKYTQLEKV